MVELEDNDASFESTQLWCVTISVFTTVQGEANRQTSIRSNGNSIEIRTS
jgi:hypothetical protein